CKAARPPTRSARRSSASRCPRARWMAENARINPAVTSDPCHFLCHPLGTDNPLAKRGAPRTAVHVVGPGGRPIGPRMQPRNRQGPNAVEAAAIPPEVVAPRERWAKLAKWTTAELHGRLHRPASTPLERHPARS